MTNDPTNSVFERESGMMLVAAMLSVSVMMGITYLYFAASWRGMDNVADGLRRDRILYLAEAGVGEGLDHLNRGGDAVVIDRQDDPNWPYWVRILDRGIGSEGQEVFEVESTVRSGRDARTVDSVVENRFRTPRLGGAVQSGEKCFLVGDCIVDGRDHDSLGLGAPQFGIHGFVAAGAAFLIDDPSVGGNGIAPMMTPDDDDGVFI